MIHCSDHILNRINHSFWRLPRDSVSAAPNDNLFASSGECCKLGLQVVHAQGEPFDPHQHQAIEMVETDEVPDGHVFDELQPGYKLKDRLLRPAMVRVAKSSK